MIAGPGAAAAAEVTCDRVTELSETGAPRECTEKFGPPYVHHPQPHETEFSSTRGGEG